MNNTQYTAAIITVSDKSYNKERTDLSGPVLEECLKQSGYSVINYEIVPDDIEKIQRAIQKAAIMKASLILTTGGTGFSKRDVTPEATLGVIEKEAKGISEAIRANSMKITNRAMLSRGVSGIIDESVVVNLPGSPKAAKESLEVFVEAVKHGIDVLVGKSFECGSPIKK